MLIKNPGELAAFRGEGGVQRYDRSLLRCDQAMLTVSTLPKAAGREERGETGAIAEVDAASHIDDEERAT
jgi:hypothetical protein